MIYTEIEGRKWVREMLPWSHKVQNGPTYFLNSFSERSLHADGSRLTLTLYQWFISKALYMCSSSLRFIHS